MTLQQLKYVLAIADKGSINEAAKSLFISQPSLSNSIKELEQELQITIFVRTNRGMTLTNDGYEFIGYARQVFSNMRYSKKNILKISMLKNTSAYLPNIMVLLQTHLYH